MAHHTTSTVSNVDVTISYTNKSDNPVEEAEIKAYIERAYQNYPGKALELLNLEVDGEEVGIKYGFEPVSFDRIRRITGYLVGTMDRWNDAKTSEERSRVKHEVSC